jgi:hypothetical protein
MSVFFCVVFCRSLSVLFSSFFLLTIAFSFLPFGIFYLLWTFLSGCCQISLYRWKTKQTTLTIIYTLSNLVEVSRDKISLTYHQVSKGLWEKKIMTKTFWIGVKTISHFQVKWSDDYIFRCGHN